MNKTWTFNWVLTGWKALLGMFFLAIGFLDFIGSIIITTYMIVKHFIS